MRMLTTFGTVGRSLVAGLAMAAAMASWPLPAHAADPVVLTMNVPADQAGRPAILIDRDAITSVVVEKGQDIGQRISITFHPEARPRFVIQCNDQAAAQMLVDALRTGATPTLDVTSRCKL